MRHATKLTVIFVLLIFILSCTDSGGGSSNTNWRTGTQGIVMNFAQDNPPSELLNTQELSVIVEYSNKGAYDVPAGNLIFYLSGYDPSILFKGAKSAAAGAIEGKSQFNTQGSQTALTGWTSNIDISGVSGVDSFRQDVTVTACYNYGTIATPTVCVDPQKYDLVVSTRCNFDVEDLGGSQGGPIAVTNIKKRTTKDKVYFEIYIRNSGGGIPFVTDIKDCHNSLSIKDIDTVKIGKVTLSGRTLKCNPSDIIRLNNNQGYFVCERDMPEKSFFTGVMEIHLTYGYRETISRSLTIVNIDR